MIILLMVISGYLLVILGYITTIGGYCIINYCWLVYIILQLLMVIVL
jgi:hypothetical protein